jgi:hypothetical protein
MVIFPKMYTLYIQKEQFAGQKNELAMRKSPGHFSRARILKLTICKENPLKLYKIEIAMNFVSRFFNGRLEKWMFYSEKLYTLYTERTNRGEMTKPCEISWTYFLG